MQVIYRRYAELDIHKKTVVVIIMITQDDGTVHKYTCIYSTMTAGLLTLDVWLESLEVNVIALESTGIYWHSVYNLLEEGRTIILMNPHHICMRRFQTERQM